MKKIVKCEEVEGEGLLALLGQQVIVFCMNYFYSGILLGVNKEDILLEGAKLVFDTGKFDQASWSDAQTLPAKQWYVRIATIESYGPHDKK